MGNILFRRLPKVELEWHPDHWYPVRIAWRWASRCTRTRTLPDGTSVTEDIPEEEYERQEREEIARLMDTGMPLTLTRSHIDMWDTVELLKTYRPLGLTRIEFPREGEDALVLDEAHAEAFAQEFNNPGFWLWHVQDQRVCIYFERARVQI